MRLLKSIIDEIKRIITDPSIMILLFIGPIALTIVFGGVYSNTYMEHIPIAVLDEDNTSLSRTVVQYFDENDRFTIKDRPANVEELKTLIDDNKVMMGLYIPKEFANDAKTQNSASVLAIVNGANLVIANNCYAQATTIVQTVSAGVEIKVLQAKGLQADQAMSVALPFKFEDRTLYDQRMMYLNYLLLGFVAMILQQVMLSGFGFSVLRDIDTTGRRYTIGKLALKLVVCGTIALAAVFISIQEAIYIFGIEHNGNIWLAMLVAATFLIALSAPSILIAAITKDKLRYAQFCFLLSLPTFVSSGYIWPLEQMPGNMGFIVKLLWPVTNFARVFDEIIIKGLTFDVVKQNIIDLLIYAAVWLPVAIIVLKLRTLPKKSERQTDTETGSMVAPS